MVNDLILKGRSIRRFWEDIKIDKSILKNIVDSIRNTPSARNIQPLKYSVITSEDMCSKLFPTLSWAGYIENGAPQKGERPSGYIVIFNDTNIAPNSLWDQGIVAQTIALSLAEKELGCCIIASINRSNLKSILNHSDNLEAALIIAIGHPKERVEIVEMKNNEYKYYRDENDTHFVPKRSLEEVYLEFE